jgi:Flavodoxin
MRAVIVFESMFGNTHQIAEAIGVGLAELNEVSVISVNVVDPATVAAADLVLVGGPTHVHGMSRPSTRAEAEKWALDPLKKLRLESGAPGRGIREWLDDHATEVPGLFATFATRVEMPIILSGNAAAQMDRALHRRGSRRLAAPENFLVTKDTELSDGEIDRATDWGRSVGAALSRMQDGPGTESSVIR